MGARAIAVYDGRFKVPGSRFKVEE